MDTSSFVATKQLPLRLEVVPFVRDVLFYAFSIGVLLWALADQAAEKFEDVGLALATQRVMAKNASDSRPMGNKSNVGLELEVVPFAAGASREAFRAKVEQGGCYKGYTNGTKLVLKTFKSDYYNKGLRVSQQDVDMQEYVKQLAEDFNEEVGLQKKGQPCNFYVRVAKLDEFQRDIKRQGQSVFLRGESFLVEQEIKGTFKKFNSNSGWSSGDPYCDAFSHWSWVQTDGSAVVCDLQGVRGEPGEPPYGGSREQYYYLITDPAINSTTKRFGVSDMGRPGISTFFYKHVCGDLCRQLGLHRQRPQGKQLLPVVRESSYGSLSSTDLYRIPQQGRQRSSLNVLEEFSEEDEEEDSEGDDDVIRVSPKDIFFTHDSIKDRFSCGRFIEDTYQELLRQRVAIEDIPMMQVAEMNGKYWTYTGNRRLWVFRRLNAAGRLRLLDVQLVQESIPRRRFTTQNGGVSVEVRRHR